MDPIEPGHAIAGRWRNPVRWPLFQASSALVWIILILVLLLLVIWFVRIELALEYVRRQEDDQLTIRFSTLWGLLRWKKCVQGVEAAPHPDTEPPADLPKQNPSITHWWHVGDMLRQVRRICRVASESKPVMRALLRRCRVYQCRVRVELGTGDVISSGMACGTAWAVLATVLGGLSHVMRFTELPDIRIEPVFDRRLFAADVRCIVDFPLGYAIVAGLRLMRAWRRGMADGTSYPRLDADRHEQYS